MSDLEAVAGVIARARVGVTDVVDMDAGDIGFRPVPVLTDVGQVARTAEVVIQTGVKIAEAVHESQQRRTREEWNRDWGSACQSGDALAMSRLLAERDGNPDLRLPVAAADRRGPRHPAA